MIHLLLFALSLFYFLQNVGYSVLSLLNELHLMKLRNEMRLINLCKLTGTQRARFGDDENFVLFFNALDRT